MSNTTLVKKASGELQPFSPTKLENSLRKAGAEEALIREIVADIQSGLTEGHSTRNIYSRAFMLLRRKKRSIAARYSLKTAIMQLGPTGFPFEQFIGHVFKHLGFDVLVGQVIQGHCVTHEVDVIATNKDTQRLVECKYYNSQDKYASVQVPLYIRSRINDIVSVRQNMPQYQNLAFEGWIVTNTRFTTDAMSFGTCSGLNLLSWNHPQNNSLKDLVERFNVFPVTTLTLLTKSEKQALVDKGHILCRQINENPALLDFLELTADKKQKVLEEIRDLSNS